jgi:hypothetical protein
MIRRSFCIAVLVPMALALAGCRSGGRPEVAPSNSQTLVWVKTELYLGLSRPGGGEVTQDEWDVFLAREITSRFPNGLTVLDAHGQWRDESGTVIRERTKLLILLYESSPDRERAVDEIVRIYKERFQQESVLRVRQRADVSF